MSEVKTFIPNTPVEFSAGLISALDASNDSTASRVARKDQLVALEVNSKLAQLQKDKSQALGAELQAQILAHEPESKLVSSKALAEKLDAVTADLKKINAFKPAKTPALVDAEAKLTQCLIDNRAKPLKCWDEMTAFKTLAKDF